MLGTVLLLVSLAGVDLVIRFGPHPVYVLNVVLCALVSVAQVARRASPRWSFLVTIGGLGGYAVVTFVSPVALGVSPVCLAALASVHAMVRWDPRPAWRLGSVVAGLAGAAANPFTMLTWGRVGGQPMSAFASVPLVSVVAVTFGCAVSVLTVAADAMRRRHREQDRLDVVARQRQAAIVEERLMIARELHDVVGHGLTAIKVQAATARAMGDGAVAHEALKGIEHTAASSLSEVRDLVRVLRTSAAAVGFDGVERAIDTARAAGLDLSTQLPERADVESRSRHWSLLSRMAVVRVVQEGLTNALRHGDGRAHLTMAVVGGECLVRLINGLPDHPTPEVDSPGSGLAGLAERVALAGGTLTTEAPAGQRSHVLVARIPVRDLVADQHD